MKENELVMKKGRKDRYKFCIITRSRSGSLSMSFSVIGNKSLYGRIFNTKSWSRCRKKSWSFIFGFWSKSGSSFYRKYKEWLSKKNPELGKKIGWL